MPLVPLWPLLRAAAKHGFAHGAFNINTPAQGRATIEVHEMLHSACILEVIDFAHGFMAGRKDYLQATLTEKALGARRMVEAIGPVAANASVPVVLHLDHATDPAFVKACVDAGYTSVMIDGSALPFAQNAAVTRDVVEYAHARGVSVEGELGLLGGREDLAGVDTAFYTDPGKVPEFIRETGVDCLAISYGTRHGAAKGKNVVIRKEIAIAARENLLHQGMDACFVSHGSSTVPRYIVEEINALGGNLQEAHGIPIAQIREVIGYGIVKVNVGTDLRLAITRNIRRYFHDHPERRQGSTVAEVWRILTEDPGIFDERKALVPIIDAVVAGASGDEGIGGILKAIENGVKEAVTPLIVQFGSAGHAAEVETVSLEQMRVRYLEAKS